MSLSLAASCALAGGVGAPILFGWIIGTGSRTALLAGYLVAAGLMIGGALVEAWLGVDAERKSLEEKLSIKLADAEKTIASTREAAMSNVRGIAADAATAIVQRLSGVQPDAQSVNKAVDASARAQLGARELRARTGRLQH